MAPVALVTGGARRIGRAIVERLAAEGYAVAIHCERSVKEAEALAGTIAAAGGRAALVRGALEDVAAGSALVEAAESALGPVTLLVNNASEFVEDTVESLDEAIWDRQFAVNLRAPAFLVRDFARRLPPGAEGCVVNVLDQRVLRPTPRHFSYALTKAALWAATRTMAQALAPRIRVNAVGPGPTLKSAVQDDAAFAEVGRRLPLGRGPTPEEVAEAVAYLARARSVTGQMIAVDGGQHLAWRTPETEIPE
ncbi:MAG TPA: SDR family oxidoreductase [Beijerinckiaceae bacterium]|nr:SDR family oxidoreductase [Beijerinckiaceae bacterium]